MIKPGLDHHKAILAVEGLVVLVARVAHHLAVFDFRHTNNIVFSQRGALGAAAGVGDLGSGLEAAGTEQEAIEVIRLLLELGLNINVVDDNGETAVHGAAYQNWPGLIRFLVAHGARVDVWNQPNRWGWTPLIIAHGYREGNFRPDAATIECLEEIMRAANVPVPEDPGRDVKANQQSWDRKPPKAGQKPM